MHPMILHLWPTLYHVLIGKEVALQNRVEGEAIGSRPTRNMPNLPIKDNSKNENQSYGSSSCTLTGKRSLLGQFNLRYNLETPNYR